MLALYSWPRIHTHPTVRLGLIISLPSWPTNLFSTTMSPARTSSHGIILMQFHIVTPYDKYNYYIFHRIFPGGTLISLHDRQLLLYGDHIVLQLQHCVCSSIPCEICGYGLHVLSPDYTLVSLLLVLIHTVSYQSNSTSSTILMVWAVVTRVHYT